MTGSPIGTIPNHSGPSSAAVIWITGLAGTGKTTLARALTASIRTDSRPALLLDGEHFRVLCQDDLGYSPAERLFSARRLSKFAAFVATQGITTVVATISLFHAIHALNRRIMPRYLEIYLHAPLAALLSRDPKGLYARATAGLERNVVGLDIPFEQPTSPHLSFNLFEESDLYKVVHNVRQHMCDVTS